MDLEPLLDSRQRKAVKATHDFDKLVNTAND